MLVFNRLPSKDSIILSITDLVFLEFYLIVTIVLPLFAPAYDVVLHLGLGLGVIGNFACN